MTTALNILNDIKPNKGATKKRMRVGRGIGSGKGKTCGRGGKGQTARSGVAIKGFEGGQTPIHRRLPKRGFNNFSRKDYEVVNLSDIQNAIDEGKLQANGINAESLKTAGLTKNRLTGIKLLGSGELKSKIEISVCKASESAKQAVEKSGGKITLLSA
ncbi:MAG: 50S ribosomal protein L15 [Rickettsiales bacterium]|nr:50S ribosomal protein L15 [Rickettsiales bacterium]